MGKADEAIALVRPHTDTGRFRELRFFARLSARHGCGDEAFSLLSPYVADGFLAAALVDVAAGANVARCAPGAGTGPLPTFPRRAAVSAGVR